MAWTLLASTVATSTNVTTPAIDTTGATLIVVYSGANAADVLTVTDSLSNTWTKLTTRSATAGGSLSYCKNPITGTAQTFTKVQNYGIILVQAWRDSLVSSPFDQENGAAQDSVATKATGSITTGLNQELIVTAVHVGASNSSYLIDNSFTISNSKDGVSGNYYGGAMGYYIVPVGVLTVNPTWSWTGSSNCAVAIATFKPIPIMLNNYQFASAANGISVTEKIR